MICCDKMKYFIDEQGKNYHDKIIVYSDIFDEYGIAINDGGNSYVTIDYCPWCGEKLPESKRKKWFDELEKLGIENPLEDDIPLEFKSSIWRE